jgi:hypothetical protein
MRRRTSDQRFRLLLAALALGVTLLLGGCADAQARETEPARGYTPRELQAPQRHGGAHAGGTASGDTDRGAAFARWVLEQDPRREYLTDAVVRGDRVLGIKVRPGLTDRQLGELMEALAEGMAETFPGRRPLAVQAFDQAGDRRAEGVYDPRTGRFDVQFG